MTKTQETLSDQEISKIIPDTGVERPKTEAKMTYFENTNIDEVTHQNMRKKDVYETDMHKIYNIILGQTNKHLQDKATSDRTFQAVKTGCYPIG